MKTIEKTKNSDTPKNLIGIETEILNWIISKVKKSKKEAIFIKNITANNFFNHL
jgi:hypothetical protein